MTLQQLGEILNQMYVGSDDRETAAMVHLFGIKYAQEIRNSGTSMKAIARAAGIPESYGTEISKGVKLSRWVVPR